MMNFMNQGMLTSPLYSESRHWKGLLSGSVWVPSTSLRYDCPELLWPFPMHPSVLAGRDAKGSRLSCNCAVLTKVVNLGPSVPGSNEMIQIFEVFSKKK